MDGIKELRKEMTTSLGSYGYYDLKELTGEHPVESFPFSIRILLENILRNFNGNTFNKQHLDNILHWRPDPPKTEIPYFPARVLMQDFTGVPSVVDLSSIRSEVNRRNKDPQRINPQVPVDLIIDHSVQVDYYSTSYSYQKNVDLEYERNSERYSLLKWAKSSFENFNVLPPGMGICHQVNLEFLAKVAVTRDGLIFPDTLVGTDSHTPMINGVGVIGWGVGGIEAEAVMLGQPIYIMLPEVIGVRLIGALQEGTTATDLVLTIANLLRKRGVVGKFVEVFGEGLINLTVPDRATISNMSPEFGCTVTYFPPDSKTLEYLRLTGREGKLVDTVEQYMKANLLWRENEDKIRYTDVLEVRLNEVEPSIAGPKRPQDKIPLRNVKKTFIDILKSNYERDYVDIDGRSEQRWSDEGGNVHAVVEKPHKGETSMEEAGIMVESKVQKWKGLKSIKIKRQNTEYLLSDGAVVIAAITSCTNTSNPGVMLGAGLLAKKAVERGLFTKPWVKTSLAPGSRVVTDYLQKAGLLPYLEALGFHVVGYGCTTCIGNSGPLQVHIHKAITENDLIVASVLSGNRNYEARIHPLVKMNFLTSPILVVAYALPGRIDINLQEEPLGYDPNLEPVYLRDIWPTSQEIQTLMSQVLDSKDFVDSFNSSFQGDERWDVLQSSGSSVYQWDETSSYIREAPFFRNLSEKPEEITDISSARILLKLGDSITTDHISPAGSISETSPAGVYLKSLGIEKKDFNSYGSRRGNHEVMVRGTFANVRLKNELADREGGWTRFFPSGEEMTIYDASVRYKENNTPLVIAAGKEYGSGSSRDWAAKGVALLGVRAILAESFERIHRSNLVGMGILPLQFSDGENAASLGIRGDEVVNIDGLQDIRPNKPLKIIMTRPDASQFEFSATARLDSPIEVAYFKNGGILQYVLRENLGREG